MGVEAAPQPTSPRRAQLLDRAYTYVLEHGLDGLSLRPLAAATGTSPRVLLYLFGSKDGLMRELLARARDEQLAMVAAALEHDIEPGADEVAALLDRLWRWLSAPERRGSVRLTYEAFLCSLRHDPGPWRGFATEQVQSWLHLLCAAQTGTPPDLARARATYVLAVVRGLLLDLLACDEPDRVRSALPPH
jgi:AcrR family transcriptional regulator